MSIEMYGCVHNNCMFLRCFNGSGLFCKSGHKWMHIEESYNISHGGL